MIYLYIYLTGLILSVLMCRFIPGTNSRMHETINSSNPSVFFAIWWPVVWCLFLIIDGYKYTMSSLNWLMGNGFVSKTMKVSKKSRRY